MTGLWLWVIAMTVVAVLIVGVPLMRRRPLTGLPRTEVNATLYRRRLTELEADREAGTLAPDQFDQAREELEQELLGDLGEPAPAGPTPRAGRPWAALAVLVVAIPVLAGAIYQRLGTPEAVARAEAPADAAPEVDPRLAELVQRLEERLHSEPEDAEGWAMLGRTYTFMERYRDAAVAYGQAYVLVDDPPPNLVADYAEALAIANDDRMAGAPARLAAAALARDPGHEKALWLTGMAAFQSGDYARAEMRWERLAQLSGPDAPSAGVVQEYLSRARAAQARAQSGTAPAAEAATAPAAQRDAEAGAGTLEVSIELAPALRERMDPDQLLFVFARAAEGPPMPLAAVRRRAGDLPLTLTLSDAQAMTPTMTLSRFDRVVVGARISESGSPTADSGDLQGFSDPVRPGDGPVTVVIDNVVP